MIKFKSLFFLFFFSAWQTLAALPGPPAPLPQLNVAARYCLGWNGLSVLTPPGLAPDYALIIDNDVGFRYFSEDLSREFGDQKLLIGPQPPRLRQLNYAGDKAVGRFTVRQIDDFAVTLTGDAARGRRQGGDVTLWFSGNVSERYLLIGYLNRSGHLSQVLYHVKHEYQFFSGENELLRRFVPEQRDARGSINSEQRLLLLGRLFNKAGGKALFRQVMDFLGFRPDDVWLTRLMENPFSEREAGRLLRKVARAWQRHLAASLMPLSDNQRLFFAADKFSAPLYYGGWQHNPYVKTITTALFLADRAFFASINGRTVDRRQRRLDVDAGLALAKSVAAFVDNHVLAESAPLSYAPLGVDTPDSFRLKYDWSNAAGGLSDTGGVPQALTAEYSRLAALYRYKNKNDSDKKSWLGFSYETVKPDRLRQQFLALLAGRYHLARFFEPTAGGSGENNSWRVETAPVEINNKNITPLPLENQRLPFIFGGKNLPPASIFLDKNATPYHRDKVAGVSEIGLLFAALALTEPKDRFAVFDAAGNDILQNLRLYYQRLRNDTAAVRSGEETMPLLRPESLLPHISLLPTLELLRPGDVLLRRNGARLVDLAIVTSVESAGPAAGVQTKPAALLSVDVVCVNRKQGVVAANSWRLDSLGNTDTGGWQGYRLLLAAAPDSGEESTEVDRFLNSWLTPEKTAIFSRFQLTRDGYGDEPRRYLPNTGNFVAIDRIYIDSLFNKRLAGLPVRVAAVVSSRQQDENQHTVSSFRLFAGNRSPQVEIAHISPADDGESAYQIRQITPLTLVEEAGGLVIAGAAAEHYRRFFIAADALQSRAGDTLQVTFQIINSPDGGEQTVSITAREDDYFTIYDKKLLWRANLYIDESRYYGKNDWNDLNRWSDDDNDWLPKTAQDTAMLTVNSAVTGGQWLPIVSWSHYLPWKEDNGAGNQWPDSSNRGAVALSSRCYDTPFLFNLKLLAQIDSKNFFSQLANIIYGGDLSILDGGSSFLFYRGIDCRAQTGWLSTDSAGSGGWLDYHSEQATNDLKALLTLAGGHWRQEFAQYSPYRPGYSSTVADSHLTQRLLNSSAGIDAAGLIQRSAAYRGNNYQLADLPEHSGMISAGRSLVQQNFAGDQHQKGETIESIRGKSSLIYRFAAQQPTVSTVERLPQLIPGDLLFIAADKEKFSHLAMINHISEADAAMVDDQDFWEGLRLIEVINRDLADTVHQGVTTHQNGWDYRQAPATTAIEIRRLNIY